MWKFCAKAQFPHVFHARNLGEITVFSAVLYCIGYIAYWAEFLYGELKKLINFFNYRKNRTTLLFSTFYYYKSNLITHAKRMYRLKQWKLLAQSPLLPIQICVMKIKKIKKMTHFTKLKLQQGIYLSLG